MKEQVFTVRIKSKHFIIVDDLLQPIKERLLNINGDDFSIEVSPAKATAEEFVEWCELKEAENLEQCKNAKFECDDCLIQDFCEEFTSSSKGKLKLFNERAK